MAMADSAHCTDGRPATTQSPPDGLRPLRGKPLAISVIVVAVALSGCARNPDHRNLVQRETRATPLRLSLRARPHAEPKRNVELHVRRPDPALLAPQPAPNCEFKRADIKAVDPDEWARLKAEYERQCYLDAEKAARDRLGQLQGSSICEVERAPQQPLRSVTHARLRPRS